MPVPLVLNHTQPFLLNRFCIALTHLLVLRIIATSVLRNLKPYVGLCDNQNNKHGCWRVKFGSCELSDLEVRRPFMVVFALLDYRETNVLTT